MALFIAERPGSGKLIVMDQQAVVSQTTREWLISAVFARPPARTTT